MEGWQIGAIVGAVAGMATVLLFALIKKPLNCPQCGEPMPKFRKPANRQQALWGGWTCPKCGCEIDRKGRKTSKGA